MFRELKLDAEVYFHCDSERLIKFRLMFSGICFDDTSQEVVKIFLINEEKLGTLCVSSGIYSTELMRI